MIAAIGRRAPYGLGDLEIVPALRQVQSMVAMLTALASGLAAEASARGIPAQLGYRSTTTWLREDLHLGGYQARQVLALAATTDAHPAVGTAVAAGSVSPDQAAVIGQCLSSLRPRVSASVLAAAEQRLLDCAATLSPEQLAVAGNRVLAHVAPEIADEHDAEALRRAEERARIDRGLTLTPDRANHRFRLTGYLTPEMAATLTAAIDPLARKRAGVAGAAVDERTPAQRRADALEEVCRVALNATDDVTTGDRTQMAVTVSYDFLARELRSGVLDSGFALTPASARRLACDARILPAVMGGAGQVLDLGRAHRTWTGAARRAVILRDGGCVFPDCDRPPAYCDVHHVRYFRDGGQTDLANGALLCGFHHYLIHHSDWRLGMASDGMPEVIPPAWCDPAQRPRRNSYHRRN